MALVFGFQRGHVVPDAETHGTNEICVTSAFLRHLYVQFLISLGNRGSLEVAHSKLGLIQCHLKVERLLKPKHDINYHLFCNERDEPQLKY